MRDSNEEEEEDQNEEEDERLLDLSPRPTPIRIEPCFDQQNNGLIAMETGNLHLFVVAGYHGETGRTILCARVSMIQEMCLYVFVRFIVCTCIMVLVHVIFRFSYTYLLVPLT